MSGDFLDVRLKFGVFTRVPLLVQSLRMYVEIFRVYFFFKLRYLLCHASKLHLKLSYLLLCFKQILGVQISVRSHGFIQVLLLLQPAFSLYVLFLQLSYKIILEFDLLQALVVLSVGLGCFNAVLLLVLFKLKDEFLQLFSLRLVAHDLVLELLEFILKGLNGGTLVSFFLFS